MKFIFEYIYVTYRITVHKFWVARFLWKIILPLMWRSVVHDLSKYRWRELKGHIEHYAEVDKTKYGSKAYFTAIKKFEPYHIIHYKTNTHHPEHYNNEFIFMRGLDRIEMICDWQAAVKRNNTVQISESIQIGKQRYNYNNTDCDWLNSFLN